MSSSILTVGPLLVVIAKMGGGTVVRQWLPWKAGNLTVQFKGSQWCIQSQMIVLKQHRHRCNLRKCQQQRGTKGGGPEGQQSPNTVHLSGARGAPPRASGFLYRKTSGPLLAGGARHYSAAMASTSETGSLFLCAQVKAVGVSPRLVRWQQSGLYRLVRSAAGSGRSDQNIGPDRGHLCG